MHNCCALLSALASAVMIVSQTEATPRQIVLSYALSELESMLEV
jgi:hypothetical protein